MGKYLNGYALKGQGTYVPPGWDEWDSPIDNNAYAEFGYRLNENGKVVSYGKTADDYLTDVLARKAKAYIKKTVEKNTSFFLYLATYAPHEPATPAPRHRNLYPDLRAPRTSSFDEKDVSAKPAFVRDRRLLSDKQKADIDQLYRKRLQSLRAVDELVAVLVETLRETKQLGNTYIVFTSDNGFHLGQHRLPKGKQTAYEEDIRVPLIIRGPGAPVRHTVSELALETDLAPTFAQWGGAVSPSFVDGRSLVPLLSRNGKAPREWRQGVLVDHYPGVEPFMSKFEKLVISGRSRLPHYSALRSKRYLYVEYDTGERELYDVQKDPAELANLYASADPSLIRRLSSWLAQLKSCRGAGCRQAENSGLGAAVMTH